MDIFELDQKLYGMIGDMDILRQRIHNLENAEFKIINIQLCICLILAVVVIHILCVIFYELIKECIKDEVRKKKQKVYLNLNV